jgi:hypothetical protein
VTLPTLRKGGLPVETARVGDHSPRGPAGLVAETLRTSGQLWCQRVAPPKGPRPGGLRRSTGRQFFILPPVPQGAGPSIRERTRIANPRTKGQGMHVYAPDNITVACKATAPTDPVASFRLLVPRSLPLKHTMPTCSHFSWRYCLSLLYSH